MNNYVQYDLYLKQPVKMGSPGNQNNADALPYIAGSTIRGAFISLMIRRYFRNVKDLNHDVQTAGILFRDTRFFDAYLQKDGTLLMPVPSVYYADKHEMRAAEKERMNGHSVELPVHGREDSVPEEGEVRVDNGRWCSLDKDNSRVTGTKMCANLHIAVARDGEKGKMFRYEAIERGQTFTGFIRCKDEHDAEMYRNAIANQEVYLGGSKGSGYGQCVVRNLKTVSYDDLLKAYHAPVNHAFKQQHLLTIYALSNLILLDQNGSVVSEPEPAFLEEKLGIHDVRLEKAYVSLTHTGGYNHLWRAGDVQETAVKAGSYYRFHYEGDIDADKAESFQENGIGVRKQEGFGRILLNLDLHQKKRIEIRDQVPVNKNIHLNHEEEKELQMIQAKVNEERLRKVIRDAALDGTRHYAGRKVRMGQSQLGRLYNEVSSLNVNPDLRNNDDQARRHLIRFVDNLQIENDQGKKRFKSESAERTYKEYLIQIGDRNLKLEDLVKKVTAGDVKADELIPSLKNVRFWGKRPSEYSDFRIKLLFMQEYLHDVQREAGGRK